MHHSVHRKNAGAANAAGRGEVVSKWVNTSNPLDVVDIFNNDAGAGDFASGSEVVVLGWDSADTHTNNFWEELASVQASGSSATLSSGTFTAKKYLWVQAFVDSATTVDVRLRMGNGTADSGNNYAYRSSTDGGADSTSTSANHAALDSGTPNVPSFMNMFIINNSSNEKLIIVHQTDGDTAGAGTAPDRRETVAKWANTSNQADIIDLVNGAGTTNFTSNSILKVWGAD